MAAINTLYWSSFAGLIFLFFSSYIHSSFFLILVPAVSSPPLPSFLPSLLFFSFLSLFFFFRSFFFSCTYSFSSSYSRLLVFSCYVSFILDLFVFSFRILPFLFLFSLCVSFSPLLYLRHTTERALFFEDLLQVSLASRSSCRIQISALRVPRAFRIKDTKKVEMQTRLWLAEPSVSHILTSHWLRISRYITSPGRIRLANINKELSLTSLARFSISSDFSLGRLSDSEVPKS